MATEATIKEIFGNMLALYPLTQAEEQTSVAGLLAVWCLVLADVPDEMLQAAALEYLKSPAQWRPLPGQLRTRALELAGASLEDRAMDAWRRYADLYDKEMVNEARRYNDEIALRAISEMRMNMRRLRENAEVEEIMAERQRAFVAAYREQMRNAQALGAGHAPAGLLPGGKR